MTMTVEKTPSALDRLHALVLKAEARSKSGKAEKDMQAAAAEVQRVGLLFKAAKKELDITGAQAKADLATCNKGDADLLDLIKNITKLRASMSKDEQAEIDLEIDTSRRELARKRTEATETITRVQAAFNAATEAYNKAAEAFEKIEEDCRRLRIHVETDFSQIVEGLREFRSMTPRGALQALAIEIRTNDEAVRKSPKRKIYHQIQVWLGRFRLAQEQLRENGEEEAVRSHLVMVFNSLKSISRDCEPGYIEAFRIDYQCDWVAYIKDAEAALASLIADSQKR